MNENFIVAITLALRDVRIYLDYSGIRQWHIIVEKEKGRVLNVA